MIQSGSPFESNSVDLIVSNLGINNFSEPAKAFEEKLVSGLVQAAKPRASPPASAPDNSKVFTAAFLSL